MKKWICVFIILSMLDATLTTFLVTKGGIEQNWWRFLLADTTLFWSIRTLLTFLFLGLIVWLKSKNFKQVRSEYVIKATSIGFLILVMFHITNLAAYLGGRY